MATKRPCRFQFRTPLLRISERPAFHAIEIPPEFLAAAGRSGRVPVVVTLDGETEVNGTAMPAGGSYRLLINARTRKELGAEPGTGIRVLLEIPEKPERLPLPADLASALRETGTLDRFLRFTLARQNYLISFLEEAVQPATRERRAGKVARMMLAICERERDRQRSR